MEQTYGTKWMEEDPNPVRRKRKAKNPETPITVIYEAVEPESIIYRYGACMVTLTGLYAWLYRGMIWMYGEEEAKERFWFLFHKRPEEKKRHARPNPRLDSMKSMNEKSGATTPDNAAQTLEEGNI